MIRGCFFLKEHGEDRHEQEEDRLVGHWNRGVGHCLPGHPGDSVAGGEEWARIPSCGRGVYSVGRAPHHELPVLGF